MKYVNSIILSDVDTADQTSSTVDCSQLISGSFHIYFGDGAANGTVKLQASNDVCTIGNNPAAFSPVNWVDIPNQSVTLSSGASGLLTIQQMAYRWVRAVYTHTSGGSSTINITMFAVSI